MCLGSFRRRFWPKCPDDPWKAFACRIKKTFTSIATLVCFYCGSSLFSPIPPQYYKCRYIASLHVDGVSSDEVEDYPGQRKRHKITQLASHTKTWSGKPHGTALCHCITPSECSRIVSGTNFAKTAKLPWSLQFLFYCFLTFFSILGTRRVWAWLNHHQVRLPFFTINDDLFFFFSFSSFFFSCNHHHIRVTGKWKADLNDLEWFVRNQQTII